MLGDLQRCLRKVGYFVIHTGPAQKVLADGRNAHVLQRDAQWWRTQLQQYFQVGQVKQIGPELHIVVGPKTKSNKRIQKLVPNTATERLLSLRAMA